MGSSDGIEEKKKKDDDFREFMLQIERESDAELERILTKINAEVKKHYDENGWDNARFFGDKRSDYQNYDSWSMDRIVNIVDAIGGAIKDIDYPSEKVPGSENAAQSTIDKAKDFAEVFAGDYSLIITRVTALVSAVLSQFATSSEAQRTAELRDVPLSAGLHLFFGSSGETYRNEAFFSNQYIGSFQIAFEVFMSVDEARAVGLLKILETTQFEIEFLSNQIIKIRKAQEESLDIILERDPEDYLSTKATYDIIIGNLKADRSKVMLEYDKYNDVIRTVDRLYSKIDLSDYIEYKSATAQRNVKLEDLFNPWQLNIAKRYLSEKYN